MWDHNKICHNNGNKSTHIRESKSVAAMFWIQKWWALNKDKEQWGHINDYSQLSSFTWCVILCFCLSEKVVKEIHNASKAKKKENNEK